MTSKRNFGDQSSEEKLQEKLNIKMNKIYWEKIHQVRNQLEEKYLGYEICPKSHRDFNYNRQRFSINYEDSGVLWKDYWQKRLKEWYENDYKTQKLKIWEEVRKNFDEKQKHDESLLSENQTVSSNNTEEQTHASETDIPDVTKNEDVNLRCGEQEITSTQLHDETVEITENNQKKTCIEYANETFFEY